MRHKAVQQAVAYEQAVTPALRLSEEELHGSLKDSLARQSDAESTQSAAYSLEDALKIARELLLLRENVRYLLRGNVRGGLLGFHRSRPDLLLYPEPYSQAR